MNDTNLAIHVGLHKTGTTFIQDVLLPSLSDVAVIRGWHSFRQLVAKSKQKSTLVITDESLAGKLWERSYFSSFEENVAQLKSIYNEPKIIVGIREHTTFILSLYKQYLQEGGTEPLDYLYNAENTGMLKDHDLLFYPRIKLLQENFEEVWVYNQGILRDNLPLFVKDITRFLEVENDLQIEALRRQTSNVGIKTQQQARILRQLNTVAQKLPIPIYDSKILAKYRLKPSHIVRKLDIGQDRLQLSPALKAHIQKRFAEDWQQVQPFLFYHQD